MFIKVKIKAGAKEELFKKISDDSFRISVREEAKEGKANARILALLRRHFGREAAIRMVKGHSSPSKIFEVALHLR